MILVLKTINGYTRLLEEYEGKDVPTGLHLVP